MRTEEACRSGSGGRELKERWQSVFQGLCTASHSDPPSASLQALDDANKGFIKELKGEQRLEGMQYLRGWSRAKSWGGGWAGICQALHG